VFCRVAVPGRRAAARSVCAEVVHRRSSCAERKLGSAVVVDGNEVVGVFTTVDELPLTLAAVERV
jgi:hypothetical protein